MNDEAKDSQQEAHDDSALQTPQPDQPHPPTAEPDPRPDPDQASEPLEDQEADEPSEGGSTADDE